MVQSSIFSQISLQFSIVVIRLSSSEVASEEIISASIFRPRHTVMQGKGFLFSLYYGILWMKMSQNVPCLSTPWLRETKLSENPWRN